MTIDPAAGRRARGRRGRAPRARVSGRAGAARARLGVGVRALVLLVLLALLAARPAGSEPFDPLRVRAQLLYEQIYDVTAWALRVPYALAMPIVVRARLEDWIDELELDPEVRQRVRDRIGSPVLVDEIVPFLMAVKDRYSVGEDAEAPFEAVLRQRYGPDEDLPGMEHSLFAWAPSDSGAGDTEEGGAGFSLDPELSGRIVTLYDALYLSQVEAEAGLGEELASCARREDPGRLRAAVVRTRPLVRRLVVDLRDRLALEGELADFVDLVLDDPERLETVTASGIEFLDRMVCRSYRIFATRLVREQQLRTWLLQEFERPDGGALWRFLGDANHGRRYAVLVVVDGLQGHLVEALARGSAEDPFLRAVLGEQRRAGGPRPTVGEPRAAPAQQIRYLASRVGRAEEDPRYLPFFRDLYRDDGPGDARRPDGVARGGLSTTPTISVRNLPIAWTGAPVAGPGGTGVPNFHFVDREYRRNGRLTGRPYYFFGNDALRLLPLTREAGMRTLFDRLPRQGSYACAAQYDEASHDGIDAFLNLALGESQRDFAERLCMTALRRRAHNEQRLRRLRGELLRDREELVREVPVWRLLSRSERRDRRALARRALEEIAALEQETLPELLIYYNPWPDHFAHFKGPFSDEIIGPSGELARLDHWLGVLAEIYREGGVEGRTLFGMAGDHGLAPAFHLLNPEEVIFDALREEGVDFRVLKISSDEGEGPKLNNPFDPPEVKGYDVVVASTAGGNYMLDFFRDQGTGWAEQPLRAQLESLALIPRTQAAEPVRVDVVGEILGRLGDTLDYLVVREAPCDASGGGVRVVGLRGGERADGWITRRGGRVAYRFSGADLLGTDRPTPYQTLSDADRQTHAALRERCLRASREPSPRSWCSEAEWRALTSYTARPDSVVQLAHLYDSARAGSVNLFPREGVGYNSLVPGRHAGESFHEKDAFAGFWGAPVALAAGRGRPRALVNGQVPIGLYEYLRGRRVSPEEVGFGHPGVGRTLFPGSLQPD
ncbi:MAG: alkaline phosphatase family protein [Myxococcota bacterium]